MIKAIQIFFLFLIAPFIGFFLAFYEFNPIMEFDKASASNLPVHDMANVTDKLKDNLNSSKNTIEAAKDTVNELLSSANHTKQEYMEQQQQLNELVATSQQQIKKSDDVLEQILSNLLGDPIRVHDGKNSTIKVYSLVDAGYRGYMAKIHPKNSNALKVVLADDKVVSNGETPSQAAKRTGAILSVNGGGFWRTEDGKIAPLGITVVDGKIKTFYDHPTLSFVGFNKSGQLVGGKIASAKEIKQKNILQGASFAPTLLENGKKSIIPTKWKNEKHPRTIVGNFSNGELLFIVIDGRRQGWSSGVTLEELQDKLLSFKIKDAFTLDGGGSSSFYFDGKVLNKPSDGRERPVTTNIVIFP